MRYLSFVFSLIALILSFLAYQNTKDLSDLKPLAIAVAEAKSTAKIARDKTADARQKLAQFLIDLAENVKK